MCGAPTYGNVDRERDMKSKLIIQICNKKGFLLIREIHIIRYPQKILRHDWTWICRLIIRKLYIVPPEHCSIKQGKQ